MVAGQIKNDVAGCAPRKVLKKDVNVPGMQTTIYIRCRIP